MAKKATAKSGPRAAAKAAMTKRAKDGKDEKTAPKTKTGFGKRSMTSSATRAATTSKSSGPKPSAKRAAKPARKSTIGKVVGTATGAVSSAVSSVTGAATSIFKRGRSEKSH